MNNKRITIKEIAKLANLSTATVSYALNNKDSDINEATKKRILQIANEMNYQPNLRAKGLKTNKYITIGVIVEDFQSFFVPSVVNGICACAEEHNYNVLLENLRMDSKIPYYSGSDLRKYKSNISRVIGNIINMDVDGIIYVSAYYKDIGEIVKDTDKPMVLNYCYSSNKPHYSVHYNDAGGAYKATKYLIDNGHKDIAIMAGYVNTDPTLERLKGYCKALEESNITFNPEYIKFTDWSLESAYKSSLEVFSSDNLPTAIFSMSDLMSIGVIKAAREKNLRVPEDISVVGFDNSEYCNYISPGLTSVKLPLYDIGYQSAQMLIQVINGAYNEGEVKRLECCLVERNSVIRKSF